MSNKLQRFNLTEHGADLVTRIYEYNVSACMCFRLGNMVEALENCSKCGETLATFEKSKEPCAGLMKAIDDSGSGTVIVEGEETSLGEPDCENIGRCAKYLKKLYLLEREYLANPDASKVEQSGQHE